MSKHRGKDDVVTITVVEEDFTGRKTNVFRTNANDVRSVARVFTRIVEKYSLPIFIRYLDKKDYVEAKTSEKDSELKW